MLYCLLSTETGMFKLYYTGWINHERFAENTIIIVYFSFIQSDLLVFFFIRIIATVTFWETLYYFWFYTSVHIHGCGCLILHLLQTFQQNTETSFTFNLKHIVRSKSLPSYRAEHYILGTHNIPHWKRKQLILIGDADKKKYIRNRKNGCGWKTHIIFLLSVTCCYVLHID